MGRKAVEMIGKRFGRIVVLSRGSFRAQGGGVALWLCKCDCGATVELRGSKLRTGDIKSCGCFRRDRMGGMYRTHGKSKTIEYCMFYDARKRAQRTGLPFSIEPSDIVIPQVCPVLGIKLVVASDRESAPSLDRIIPQRGYTKANIRVISFRANRLKSDATVEELQAILSYVKDSTCGI